MQAGLLLPMQGSGAGGWEQGLRLEVAEIGLDLVCGGRRELLWHVGGAGLGKVWNVQEGAGGSLSTEQSHLKPP